MELGPKQVKWLEALESGQYKQCKGRLTKGRKDGTVGFCCLGVADEVLGLGEKCPYSLHYTHEKLELKSPCGTLDALWKHGTKSYDTLASANDAGVRFKTIAKFIRENPEQVFTESV